MPSSPFAIVALALVPAFLQVQGVSASPDHASNSVREHRHGPVIIRAVSPDGTFLESSNWGGYAATGSNVTSAKASWIVPAVKCTSPSTGYSSFWVGIDGYNSKTVEQTGTQANCTKGKASYSAWYGLYPNPPVTISGFTVAPGDRITASVTYSGGKFTVNISDDKGHSSTHTAAVADAKRSSAEWIVEAPTTTGGIEPLVDFGTGDFGDDHTGVSGTCEATIGGTSGPISKLKYTSIGMKDPHGQSATPSGLSSDGTSFTVAWK
jgi:hypothetical protein